jgi:uncharacterized protein YcbX
MLADGERFLTGRAHPRMVLIEAAPDDTGVTFTAPGMGPLRVECREMVDSAPVRVWGTDFEARVGSDEADFWFSDFLGANCRLAYADENTGRRTKQRPSTPVGFADGYPVLLIGSASLADLNQRLARPVTMRNFRTNLVVGTSEPFIEDNWQRLRIGEVEFEFVKRCVRCIFTTVNPETATRDAERQPLQMLNDYRNTDDGPIFGINLIARNVGILRVGAEVEVLG